MTLNLSYLRLIVAYLAALAGAVFKSVWRGNENDQEHVEHNGQGPDYLFEALPRC